VSVNAGISGFFRNPVGNSAQYVITTKKRRIIMAETIVTKSNKANREVTTAMPSVLQTDKLAVLVNILGEEMVVQKVQAQLTVDFRSLIRSKLESTDDNGDPRYTDEEIANGDYGDWKPEARTRKSAEERAAELLSKLSPDQVKAALAMVEGNKG
jgi:hypothetical protein